MDLDTRKIDRAKRSGSQIRNAGCRCTHQNDLVLEGSRCEFPLRGIRKRNIRIRPRRPVIIDHHPAHVVGSNDQLGTEFDARHSSVAVIQNRLFVCKTQIDTQSLHIERRIKIPIRAVGIAPVRDCQRHPTYHRIRIHKNVEETAPAFFRCNRTGQKFGIGFGAARYQVFRLVLIYQTKTTRVADGGRLRVHQWKRKQCNQVRIAVKRFPRHSLKVCSCIQKIIAQHHASKPVDRIRKLLVVVVLFFFALDFRLHRRISRHTFLSLLGETCRKIPQGARCLIGLAERNVERHHASSILAQRVNQMRKMNSRKRPVSDRFLRLLIDVYDHDTRVRLHTPAILKTKIQAAQFQPRNEIEQGHGPLAHKRNVVNSQRRQRDNPADQQRAFMLPPLLQKSGTFGRAKFGRCSHLISQHRTNVAKQKSRKASKRVHPIQVSSNIGWHSAFHAAPCGLIPAVFRSPLPLYCGTPSGCGSSMSGKKQVWYIEGSAAAELAAPLHARYDLRPVQENDLHQTHSAQHNGTPSVWLADMKPNGEFHRPHSGEPGHNCRVIAVFSADSSSSAKARPAQNPPGDRAIFAFLPSWAPPNIVERTLEAAFENIELVERDRASSHALKVWEREREELNEIGVALSSQRDIGALLTLILSKTREITAADAGSLYLVEEDSEGRHLRFMLTQNDSLEFPYQEFILPLAENSMAGYTALRGEVLNFADAYEIPADRPYHFNKSYDRDSGYRTRSLLSLPMRNAKGEVLGVLQLINCKRNPGQRLALGKDIGQQVQPFRERSVRLALSLASQAAVAYENRKLYNEIETLFEGFVSAAVTAIEQRDPTTSGHSLRVAAYTQRLAEAVNATTAGPYANTFFEAGQLKEIRYAALLHDFGKVGVREEVLVKAKKLYPLQLELLRQRFDYIRKEAEASTVRRKLQAYLERDRGDALAEIARLSEDFDQRLARLQDYLDLIREANEPTLMEQSEFRKLREIAQQYFVDTAGVERPYLNADEMRLLSIPKGSLDASERLEIESHVVHTFNFLSQIPWTKELQKVPEIARAHHEKLNGTGYPYKLHGDQIPLPTKMMTICDIFDALTASDRPYKRAVPIARALSILEDCVRDGELDPDLFRVFHEEKIYERVMPPATE